MICVPMLFLLAVGSAPPEPCGEASSAEIAQNTSSHSQDEHLADRITRLGTENAHLTTLIAGYDAHTAWSTHAVKAGEALYRQVCEQEEQDEREKLPKSPDQLGVDEKEQIEVEECTQATPLQPLAVYKEKKATLESELVAIQAAITQTHASIDEIKQKHKTLQADRDADKKKTVKKYPTQQAYDDAKQPIVDEYQRLKKY